MKLSLNKEYLLRHVFSLVVFLALAGWFGFDAFVRYPNTPAHDLYVTIEKSEPPSNLDLESFKAQKTTTQRYLSLITLLVALGIGFNLFAVSRLAFSFDDEGFCLNSKRYSYNDIKKVDLAKWEKKGILVLHGESWKVELDSWHHVGVKEFYEKLNSTVDISSKM